MNLRCPNCGANRFFATQSCRGSVTVIVASDGHFLENPGVGEPDTAGLEWDEPEGPFYCELCGTEAAPDLMDEPEPTEITGVTNQDLDEALRGEFDGDRVTVVLNGFAIQDLRPAGRKIWFEYHCNESHDSSDAQAWYHSHQQVTVLGLCDCEEIAFATMRERTEQGHQLLYRVRFEDGLEWSVFEDELVDSRDDFERPDPPSPP